MHNFIKEMYGPRKSDLRLGQWAYNCLQRRRPDIATEIHGKNGLDPFYNDQNINAFLLRVSELWEPLTKPDIQAQAMMAGEINKHDLEDLYDNSHRLDP